MMKRSLRIGCIALCAVLATGCSGRNQDGNTKNDVRTETTPTAEATAEEAPKAKTGNSASEKDIGLEKAKSIALNDAGLKEKNVRFKKEKQEWDDGRMVYEIEFYSDNKEYDYEIDAESGKILEFEKEPVHA